MAKLKKMDSSIGFRFAVGSRPGPSLCQTLVPSSDFGLLRPGRPGFPSSTFRLFLHKTWVHRIFVGPFGLTCAKLRLVLGLIFTPWEWAKSDVFDTLFAPEKPKRTVIRLVKVRKVRYFEFWNSENIRTFKKMGPSSIQPQKHTKAKKNNAQNSRGWNSPLPREKNRV